MDWITLLGLVAAACTTTALFPQAIKSWKTKKTLDLSMPMCVLLTLGVALWLVYGLLINNIPLIVANAVSLLATSSTFYLKIKYG